VSPHPRARRAEPADVEVLTHLATIAVDEQRSGRGGPVWAQREARPTPFADSLIEALEADHTGVWLGLFEDVPLGYAVAHLETLRDGSRLGIIDDLFVEPQAREVGLGAALAEAIVAWCEGQGCRGIDAWALPGNRETKNFFESFGFTARGIVVHRDLATDA
jgi:GNAT superfamily N-acetyltransferase